MTVPTTEPLELRAGDQWEWRRDLTDYPASAWTLIYRFKNAAGGFEITATADGDTHVVSVASATSDDPAAGVYNWEGRVTKIAASTVKQTVLSGTVRILPTLFAGNAADALDARTHAQKMLDAIEAVLVGRASKDQQSYSIGNRSLTRIPVLELEQWRDKYRMEVLRQQGFGGVSYVRFQRA